MVLKGDFQARTREAEALKMQLARAEETLAGATDLLDKLGGERARWEQQLGGLGSELAALPAAVLAAAGFVTYLPGQPEDVRNRVMQEWLR